MKTFYALPLVLFGLFATAPAQAEEFRFETAATQLQEILEEFDFDTLEITENSEECVTFMATQAEKYIYFRMYSNDRFVCSIIWDNDRGVRRDTLMHANDWNGSSWSACVILDESGNWKLISTPPREIELTTIEAFDIVETFLIDIDAFVATF